MFVNEDEAAAISGNDANVAQFSIANIGPTWQFASCNFPHAICPCLKPGLSSNGGWRGILYFK